jgi:hypothetical protein
VGALKRRDEGVTRAPKTGKAELWGPASLCECRASRPFGTISSATARPFGLWITRSAPRFPMTRRRDPTTVLVLRRVATTWLQPWPGRNQLAARFAAQSTLTIPPHGMRRRRQTVALRAYSPLRLEPPMAMGDRGLACPVSFPTVSRSRRISPSAPSTSGPLTRQAYISPRPAHGVGKAFPHYPPRPWRERHGERPARPGVVV